MTTLQQMADATRREHSQMEALRIRIESLVLHYPGTAAATVVDAFLSSPFGLRVVRSGFGGDINSSARVSFAEFCINRDAVDVLQAVVESGMPGLTYKSTCCVTQKFGSMLSEGWSESIHLIAIKASNPQALRLAIKWDRKELSVPQKRLMGATLHHSALSGIFRHQKTESAVECCRILMAARAPFDEKRTGTTIASGLFFDDDGWDRERAPLITGLLAEYIGAGEIDLNVAPEGLKDPYNGMLPLRAAMAQGNIAGAVACIDLGCDIAKAMEFRRSGNPEDVIELARSLNFDNANDPCDMTAQMVTGITAAIMRRALREKSMDQNPSPSFVPGRHRMSV